MKEKERQNFTTYTYKRRKKIKAVLKGVGVAVVLGGAVAVASLIGTKFTTREQTATVQLNQNSTTSEKSSSEEMELEADGLWKPSSKFTTNTAQVENSTTQSESKNVSTTQSDNNVVETKENNKESQTTTNNEASYIVGHFKKEHATTHKVEVTGEHLNGSTTVAGLYNLNRATKENGKETENLDLSFGAGFTHGANGVNSGTAIVGAEFQTKANNGVVYSVNGDYAMTIHQGGVENTLTLGAGANMGNFEVGVEGYIQGGSSTKTNVGGKVVGSYKWGAEKSEATFNKDGKSVTSIADKSRNDNSLLTSAKKDDGKVTPAPTPAPDEDKKDTLTPDKEEVVDPEKENVDTEKTTETNKTTLNPEYEDTLDPEL